MKNQKIFLKIILVIVAVLLIAFLIIFGINPFHHTENQDLASGSGEMENDLDKKEQDIPLCEEIELKEISESDIIKIDDVVKNCSYEDTPFYYEQFEKGGMFDTFKMYKNGFMTYFSYLSETGDVCYHSGKIRNAPGEGWFSDLVNIVQKNHLGEKGLLSYIISHEGLLDIECRYFPADVCEDLKGNPRGEYNDHYYVYGTRNQNDFTLPIYLVIDDRLYDAGQNSYLDDTDIVLDGRWNVIGFKENSIIVSKIANFELFDKYKNNPKLLSKIFEPTKIGKFQIKTCEIEY